MIHPVPQDKNKEELDMYIVYASWHSKCSLIYGNIFSIFILKFSSTRFYKNLLVRHALSSSPFNFVHENSFWTPYLNGSSSKSKSYQRHKARNT